MPDLYHGIANQTEDMLSFSPLEPDWYPSLVWVNLAWVQLVALDNTIEKFECKNFQ